MATYRTQLDSDEVGVERRATKRFSPPLLTYFSFSGADGGSNGGMVLDVSETGVALVAALAVPHASLLNITLAADKTHQAIELKGRVAWISESKRRVGLQFSELTASNRESMKKWISGMKDTPTGAMPTIPSGPSRAPQAFPAEQYFQPAYPAKFADRGPIAAVAPPTSSSDGKARTHHFVEFLNAHPEPPLSVAKVVAKVSRPEKGIQVPEASLGYAKPGKPPIVATWMSYLGSPWRFAAPRFPAISASIAAAVRRAISFQPKMAPWHPFLVIAAVVMASFVFGVLSGRSLWAQRLHRVAAAASPAGLLAKSSGLQGTAIRETAKSDLASLAAPSVAASSAPRQESRVPPSPAVTAMNPEMSTLEKTVSAEPLDHAAGNSKLLPEIVFSPNGDIFVTANEGDIPRRVELPEDTLVQTVWLEIRSRRVALVPGSATPRGHSGARKERLIMGLLDSQVTPQPPVAVYGAARGQNAEQIVTVRATIAGDGQVTSVEPMSGSGAFVPSVISAVRQWRYDASSLNRVPIETTAELTFTFRPIR
jgi:PilZ domain-containing protein/TonB-like protein